MHSGFKSLKKCVEVKAKVVIALKAHLAIFNGEIQATIGGSFHSELNQKSCIYQICTKCKTM